MKRNLKEKFEPICANCENCARMFCGENLLCRKHGVVAPEHSCKSYILDLLKIEYRIKSLKSDFEAGDFAI